MTRGTKCLTLHRGERFDRGGVAGHPPAMEFRHPTPEERAEFAERVHAEFARIAPALPHTEPGNLLLILRSRAMKVWRWCESMPRVAYRRRASVVLVGFGIQFGTQGCDSTPCTGCSGGQIAPDMPESDPYDGRATVKWELGLDGDRYVMTCSNERGVESSDRPVEGLALICDSAGIAVGFDVEVVRVRAREVHGRWSSEGWYEARPGAGDPCACSLFTVAVPIVYPAEPL